MRHLGSAPSSRGYAISLRKPSTTRSLKCSTRWSRMLGSLSWSRRIFGCARGLRHRCKKMTFLNKKETFLSSRRRNETLIAYNRWERIADFEVVRYLHRTGALFQELADFPSRCALPLLSTLVCNLMIRPLSTANQTCLSMNKSTWLSFGPDRPIIMALVPTSLTITRICGIQTHAKSVTISKNCTTDYLRARRNSIRRCLTSRRSGRSSDSALSTLKPTSDRRYWSRGRIWIIKTRTSFAIGYTSMRKRKEST